VTRAAIFDFDGLIVDTEMWECVSWRVVYARRGLVFPFESWLSNVGRNDHLFDPLGPFRDDAGSASSAEAEWRAVAASIEPAFLVPLPGVVPLLEALRRARWRVAVASSSRRDRVAARLAQLGLAEWVDAVAGGNEVPMAKPAPDVYLLAATRVGVDPEACTALEDSEPGVRAAKAAGMRCIAVPSHITRSMDFSLADAVIADLRDASLDLLAGGAPAIGGARSPGVEPE
jgi:HAD superfamily hydrolase (TIGR01509 family)